MISIITPAYNAEKYIEQSLNSILNQTYKDIELIVVLDCPTDNTKEMVENIASKDNRVRIIENEVNLGAGTSRDIGIKAAKGDYILLNDADDYYDLDYIEKIYDAAIKNNAEIVSTGITIIEFDGSYRAEGQQTQVYEGNAKLFNQWSNNKITWMCNKLIKKTLYDLVPYVHRRYIEDTPTIIPMLWYANRMVVINNVGYYHRMVETSICHTVKPIDDAIYKALCWCDLVDFFLEHDLSIIQNTNILSQVVNNIEAINNLDITLEELKPYEHDYSEVLMRMLRYIKITSIDFKIKYKLK